MEQIKRLRYSPREAAAMLGISKAKLYDHIGSGELGSHLVDGRRWILATDIDNFISNQIARGRSVEINEVEK